MRRKAQQPTQLMTHLCRENCTYENFAPAELYGGPIWDECPECGADISSLKLTYASVDKHVERAYLYDVEDLPDEMSG